MKKLLVAILFIITIINAFTQEDTDDWRLVGNKTIYVSDSNEGIDINANSKWVMLNRIEAPFHKDFPLPPEGYVRKYRIYSKYSDSDSSVKTSFQVKFMTSSFKRPTFSFVRPLGYVGELESFSDWFQFEDGSSKRIYKGDAGVYARLISPPTTENSGKIYSIELEAWDILDEDHETMSAAGRALPGMDLFKKAEKLNSRKTKEEATEFAYQVMESVFNNDEREFNELLSDKIYSLQEDRVYFKDTVPLYAGLREAAKNSYVTMVSYKKNYRPYLMDYEEFTDLFPEWIDESREWNPGKNDYLFWGNMASGNSDNITRTRVFMISFSGNRWEIKAIPQ